VTEFFHQCNQRYAVLQRHGYAGADNIHQAADSAAFLGHSDKQFAGLPVFVQADGQVAFVAGDREFVGDAVARLGQTSAERSLRGRFLGFCGFLVGFVGLAVGVDRLEPFGAVAVNGNGLETAFPAFHVGRHNFFGGAFLGHIDGLADRARQERLYGGHHFNVGHIQNMPLAVFGLEGTVKDCQMFGLQFG